MKLVLPKSSWIWRITLLIGISYLTIYHLTAQNLNNTADLFSQNLSRSLNDEISENYDDFTILQINHDISNDIKQGNISEFQFRIPNRLGQKITFKEVLKKRSSFILLDATDKSIPLPDDYREFSGTLENTNKSIAQLTFVNDTWDLTYVDKSELHKVSILPTGDYIHYPINSEKNKENITCDAEEYIVDSSPIYNLGRSSISYTDQMTVGINMECDYSFFQACNNDMNFAISEVVRMVSTLSSYYQHHLNIEIVLNEVKIWNLPDPYASQTSIGLILNNFGAEKNKELNSLPTVFLSSRRLSASGVAYTNSICRDVNVGSSMGPYAVIGGIQPNFASYPNFSAPLFIMGHELGHVFGATHTHSCAWNLDGKSQIDDCGNSYYYNASSTYRPPTCVDTLDFILPPSGTIMSYCHVARSETGTIIGVDLDLGFSDGDGLRVGSGPKSLIRSSIMNAQCDLLPDYFLPIAAISNFEAILSEKEILVNWTINPSDYQTKLVLQKSLNAVDWFNLQEYSTKISESEPKKFTYTDPSVKMNNYYRLKEIVSMDKESYSEILFIDLSSDFDSQIATSYDPSSQIHTISINDSIEEFGDEYTVSLINSIGQTVMKSSYDIDENAEFHSRQVGNGIYFAQVLYGNTKKTAKLVMY